LNDHSTLARHDWGRIHPTTTGCAGEFLVCSQSAVEGGGELILFDLIVLVDEHALCFTDRIRLIARWEELMDMLSEFDVEGKDGNAAGIPGYGLEE
jgi:hypothetical protein